MVTVRFSNEHDRQIELMAEPWATIVDIPAVARCAVPYPTTTGRDDTTYVEYYPGMIRFWCEGDDFEVELNGKIIRT